MGQIKKEKEQLKVKEEIGAIWKKRNESFVKKEKKLGRKERKIVEGKKESD